MKAKKYSLLILIFLFICNYLQADLPEFYKKGTIKLEAVTGFGEGTDWGSLFYDDNKRLAVAPDGNIFVSNVLQHNVFKFSKEGKYLKEFGTKGQGPGDLYHPGNLSILDNKYLVVDEHASARRISLFDFNGKHFKVVRTNHSVYGVTALKENKIAYMTYKYGAEKKIPYSEKTTVIIIKDIISGNETVIDTIRFTDKSTIIINKVGAIGFKNNAGEVYLAQTKDGDLLVGASNTPEIKIYSIQGKLAHTFRLAMKPYPVTDEYIRKYKNDLISHMRGEDETRPSPKWYIKKIEAFPFESMFLEHLPYYRELLVDSEGNILVFKWTNCVENCKDTFQVYSPEGKFICETQIDKGIFDFEIDGRKKNIIFTNKGIFGLFSLKDSDDVSLRLVKVDIK